MFSKGQLVEDVERPNRERANDPRWLKMIAEDERAVGDWEWRRAHFASQPEDVHLEAEEAAAYEASLAERAKARVELVAQLEIDYPPSKYAAMLTQPSGVAIPKPEARRASHWDG